MVWAYRRCNLTGNWSRNGIDVSRVIIGNICIPIKMTSYADICNECIKPQSMPEMNVSRPNAAATITNDNKT